MKWYSTEKELPGDGEEVIMRLHNDYYLARYDRGGSVFRLTDGRSFPIKGVMWTGVTPPRTKKEDPGQRERKAADFSGEDFL